MCALRVAKIHGNSIGRELWDLLWQLPGLLVEKQENSGPERYSGLYK